MVLECTHVAIPLGAVRFGLRQGHGALVLQTAAYWSGHGRVEEGTALASVDVSVEVFVGVDLVHWNAKKIVLCCFRCVVV